jgi:excisionase family DNA binding protein
MNEVDDVGKKFLLRRTAMHEPAMSTQEAAAVLGVSIRHILTLLYERKLRAKKVGRVWRIPVTAVMQRLKGNAHA